MILAGDIGGTKAQLALFEPGADPRHPALEQRIPTRGAESLDRIVADFLRTQGVRPERSVFGIAGPIEDGRSVTTNLPWAVDSRSLAAETGAPVTLLNDLEATAWGLEALGPDDLAIVQPGRRQIGARGLIAAGTGLGEALIPWDGTRWWPSPSEGGHADFAPGDPLEDELLKWLRAKWGHVSVERVLSGPGLADLHRFMRETRRGDEPAAFAARFDAAADPAAEVTAAALDGSCGRAALAAALFVGVYGAEAGNLALRVLALGGVYVGGGIAPKMLPLLLDGRFARAFGAKGRLSPLLARIPVAVILDARTAVWGAAVYAIRHPSRAA